MSGSSDEGSYDERLHARVSEAQARWITDRMEEGDLDSQSEVVRLAIDTMRMADAGGIVILGGQAADAVVQLSEDLRLNYEEVGILATYLLAVIADLAPDLGGHLLDVREEMAESLDPEDGDDA